jgi:hypothetical protein
MLVWVHLRNTSTSARGCGMPVYSWMVVVLLEAMELVVLRM